MQPTKMFYRLFIAVMAVLLLTGIFSVEANAQDSLTADELFQQARTAAFDHKDYATTKTLLLRGLKQAPDYSDLRVFLGRIYSWTDKYDSARAAFQYVLEHHPDDEDAAAAFTDLEYWNDHNESALKVCNQGLHYHPQSETLLLKKAKILNKMRDYRGAYAVTDSLLAINPKNDAARSLMGSIRDNSSKNKIGVSYDFVYFDKQFSNPWHLLSLSYARQTKAGSVIGRINYANRFATNGLQGEIDFYPHISNTFYAYLNAGISGTNSVFPQYRGGRRFMPTFPGAWKRNLVYATCIFHPMYGFIPLQ